MVAQIKNSDGHHMSFTFFLKLIFTVFRESFKHLNKTTYIVVDQKVKGKQILHVTFK